MEPENLENTHRRVTNMGCLDLFWSPAERYDVAYWIRTRPGRRRVRRPFFYHRNSLSRGLRGAVRVYLCTRRPSFGCSLRSFVATRLRVERSGP